MGDNVQMAGLIAAMVAMIFALLKNAKWFKATWIPHAAPVLGAVIAVLMNKYGWLVPGMEMVDAIQWGMVAGLTAIGAHNFGKRLGTDPVALPAPERDR